MAAPPPTTLSLQSRPGEDVVSYPSKSLSVARALAGAKIANAATSLAALRGGADFHEITGVARHAWWSGHPSLETCTGGPRECTAKAATGSSLGREYFALGGTAQLVGPAPTCDAPRGPERRGADGRHRTAAQRVLTAGKAGKTEANSRVRRTPGRRQGEAPSLS